MSQRAAEPAAGPLDGPPEAGDHSATDAPESPKGAASGLSPPGKAALVARLQEAGVSLRERFTVLDAGSKKPETEPDPDGGDDNYRRKVRGPAAAGEHYGVELGRGVVVVDHDSHRDGDTDLPVSLPATFTVRTPHGGTHRYYVVDGDPSGAAPDWGEFKTDGEMVVGPGSELWECDEDDHDCSRPDGGQYEVVHDRPLARLDGDTLDALRGQQDGTGRAGESEGPAIAPPADGPLDTDADIADDVEERLALALDSGDGDRLQALLDGEYGAAGHPNDRSRAEWELADRLAWWFYEGLTQDTATAVYAVIDAACEERPRTDSGDLRKWTERDREYRERIVRKVCNREEGYIPPDPDRADSDSRPEVSRVTRANVNRAVVGMGEATTHEIVEHSAVDRCERHVRRALRTLRDDGTLSRRKDPEDARRWVHRPAGDAPE